MSNYTRSAYHPKERVIRAAQWYDNAFGPYRYGVQFEGDKSMYSPKEVEIPLDMIFVPKDKI